MQLGKFDRRILKICGIEGRVRKIGSMNIGPDKGCRVEITAGEVCFHKLCIGKIGLA